MNKSLSDLVKISRIVGQDSLLTQGGGGNTSVKSNDGKFMYIKASGTALKDMSTRTGWRRLKLEPVLSIIKDRSIAHLDVYSREIEVVSRLRLACDDNIKGNVRPSVESHLHAILDKFVIHLHPAAVLAYTCAKGGKRRLENLFKNEKYPPVWAGYADPGFMLARKVTKLVEDYQKQLDTKPSILFLEKHGLLISAQNASAALKLVQRVINSCNNKLIQFKAASLIPASQQAVTYAKQCIQQAIFTATGQKPCVYHFIDRDITAFLARPEAERLLSFGALTPDELLYANGPAMWINKPDREKIAARLRYQIKNGAKPAAAFLVKDTGLFVVGTKKMVPAIRQIVQNSFFIRTNANRIGGISFLNNRQKVFIYNWEADAFRKKIAEGLPPHQFALHPDK